MRSLRWTVTATADLRAIDDWLTREADPATSERVLRAILERAEFLLDFPRGGPPMGPEAGTLRVRNSPYSLVYRVTGEDIQILRVHHARQDWRPE